MKCESKKHVTCLIAGIVMLVAYILYTHSNAPELDDLKGWAVLIFVIIAASIAAKIVIRLIFRIVFSVKIAEESEERTRKLIDLKAAKVAHMISVFGLPIMLIALALGASVVGSLHLLLLVFLVAVMGEDILKVLWNERGIKYADKY
ncbi:MAG: hypothetical protein LBH88_00205 [Candidatus Methanoplasma sp.]|jgi:hypothetical protein|nr:hypothetical protein [Candidatus Methanoplasma sp.]